MSESKTKCIECGAAIQQWTADANGGRCAPCFRKVKMTPPPDFELPRELAERLVALNENPAAHREFAWSKGSEAMASYIDMLEERHAHYLEWAPRLRAFAVDCRKSRPLPQVDALTPAERAQQRIYEASIKLPHHLNRGDEMVICRIPLIAISIAESQLSHDNHHIVLLTPEEEADWNQVYSHAKKRFSWTCHFWWAIDVAPARELHSLSGRMFTRWEVGALKADEQPWLLEVVQSFGPFGNGEVDLWAWNGQEARLVKRIETWD